ncbi:MAG: di-trans,poly-cis-decaprenylcistransferase [Acidobacteria bacterium]|nr:di-trans,poly-cis-decaprenylcistransferase [Acidobacteriota bacterium]
MPVNTPQHVAIIMDGNGRWARQRGMPRWRGHEAGAGAVRRATEAACRHGISCLTLYAFSSENWKRPAKEIHILFSLLRRYLVTERQALVDNGIRLTAFGRRDRLPAPVRQALCETEEATRRGGRLHLRLAVDYGARHEFIDAARALAWEAVRGIILPDQIDERSFERVLLSGTVPAPDLIIRTAGERRLSNFLLWQAAYAELYFCPKLWPDFDEGDFEAALADFRTRTRKFGSLSQAACAAG